MSTAQVYEIAFRLGASVNSNMRRSFNDAANQLSELGNRSKLANTAMKAFSVAAVGAGAAIAGVAAGLGKAVQAADEYNSAMNQIEASTDSGIVNMKEIKSISTNLYNKNLGQDWNDLANAISVTQSVTQLSGKELEKATENAIVYRDVFGEDISQSIKATDTMMRNFGITSEQAYNLLAQGAQNGLNKSDELIDSANEYAPYFNQLGFSANQMFDTFSAGLENGAFNLDKVGDAVKEFNIRSKDGSKASSDAFQALGMDAGKMAQTFAKGGPEAQKTFQQVVQAISAIDDPVKKNAIGVALMGTQFEDLEADVVAAMGVARGQFDMTKATMEEIKDVKYDSLGMAFEGIGRLIETGLLIPIGEKLLPYMQKFSDWIYKNMPAIQGTFQKIGDKVGEAISWISSKFQESRSSIGQFKESFISNFNKVMDVVGPVMDFVGTKVMEVVTMITDWWGKNGSELLSNVQIIFNGIWKVIQFVMPAVLAIISMVWNNVKGVIQGALNVISGVVKIFAGLFTGDFSKMWEGVKQLFTGAIQFIWNWINLLFVGKILGGIKSLATGSISHISGMWATIKSFFTGGVDNAWQMVTSMGTKIAEGFTAAKTKAIEIAKSMWESVKIHFDDIVSGASSLPTKIGDGISSMAGKALEGIKSLGNRMLRGIGNMINGVIDGLNWAMKIVKIDFVIDPWTVPQYAKGTNGHPGGPAIVGEKGREFIQANGQTFLANKQMMLNLPRGASVMPNKQTEQLLAAGFPGYASGVGDFFGDIFSYISDPSKLLNKVLDKFGVEVPKFSGAFGDIAKGAFSSVKNSALGFLKEKLNGLVSLGGGSAAPDQVKSWIMQALQMTNTPLSWLPAMLTKAQKESGFNPRAINLWDSNFKAGHPSKGLFQTIDSTFNAHKGSGMNDIWNPIHNAVAAINYIKSRYGTVFNTPGIKSMMKGGAYKGYANGGIVPSTQWAWVGERGPELLKLPGGSDVKNNKKSNSLLSNLLSFGQSSSDTPGNSDPIQIHYNPTIIIEGNADRSVVDQALKMSQYEFEKMMEKYLNGRNRLSFNN